MIDLLRYGIVHKGDLTASGYDELIAAFQRKKDAKRWFKDNTTARSRINEYELIDNQAETPPAAYPEPTGESLRVDTRNVS